MNETQAGRGGRTNEKEVALCSLCKLYIFIVQNDYSSLKRVKKRMQRL
jgi:hypothetical protein